METRDWKFRKVKWNERKSHIGWMTRTIVFAALLLIGFIQAEIKPGTFSDTHRTFTAVMLGAFALVTAYLMARLYYDCEQWFERDRQSGRNDNPHYWWRPRVYRLRDAFRNFDGSILEWLNHRTIPFGYDGRSPAVLVYGLYGAIVVFYAIGYHFLPWYNAPKKPKPAIPPTVVEVWFQNYWHHLLGGVVAFILFAIIVRAIISSFKRWHYDRYVRKHVAARNAANEQSDLGWKNVNKLYAEVEELKRVAKEDKVTLEQWGELIALATQLLKRVPAKRGDGDIGEARIIIEHVLEALLITDETRRQAALYRATEQLAATERKRFQPPENEAA